MVTHSLTCHAMLHIARKLQCDARRSRQDLRSRSCAIPHWGPDVGRSACTPRLASCHTLLPAQDQFVHNLSGMVHFAIPLVSNAPIEQFTRASLTPATTAAGDKFHPPLMDHILFDSMHQSSSFLELTLPLAAAAAGNNVRPPLMAHSFVS